MIDQATRARWRLLFGAAIPGPWAYDNVERTVTGQAQRKVLVENPLGPPILLAEGRFIAEAREGWALALAELERAEAERDEAKIAIERLENQHRESLAIFAEENRKLSAELETARSREAGAGVLLHDAACMLVGLEAEVSVLRPIAEAVRAWVKHRYSPRLLEAWEASGWK